MADEFVMPKLGLTMESGTIVGWLVDDGAEVAPGQPVLVIETDKVESEVEALKPGVLRHVGQVGQEYPCGAHIGWVLADGETMPESPTVASTAADTPAPAAASAAMAVPAAAVSATVPSAANTGEGGRLLASPNAKRIAAERGVDLRTVVGSGPGGRITSEDVPTAATAASPPPPLSPSPPSPLPAAQRTRPGILGGPTPLATAAARNLADLLGVDVGQVRPAGTDPRVTKEDVAAHVRSLLAEGARPAPSQEPSKVVPLTGMRGTIATRMSESLRSMAQLSLTMDVVMDGVVADRNRRKAEAEAGGASPVPAVAVPASVVPGFTDYVISATASALVEHPHVNSQITDAGVAFLPTVNVGLAVALDDGLIVPVVQDTPSFSLEALATETSRLASAARSGSLKLPELEGGTFSVTALGMFDVDGFTPIINAPNTAILGVGRLRDGVVWSDDGQPARQTVMTLSLTWDHRAFDGAPAAEFTRAIKNRLESYA